MSSELFPLSPLPSPSYLPGPVSRPVKQRRSRLAAAASRANQIFASFNAWHSPHADFVPGPSQARAAVQDRVLKACIADRPPKDLETPEAALSVLLGSKVSSYSEGLQGLAPYEQSLVSWPAEAGNCYLADVLEGSDCLDVRRFRERLMLSADGLEGRIASGASSSPPKQHACCMGSAPIHCRVKKEWYRKQTKNALIAD